MLLLWFDSFYWSVIGDFHDSDITAARVILSLVDLSLDYWDSGDLSMRFFSGPNFPPTM